MRELDILHDSLYQFCPELHLKRLNSLTLACHALLGERIYQFGWHDILGERGLTVSIGITLHREGENTQRTFYRADKALYRAKANGRNQVCTE
ncbi:hypothetical protein THOG05_380004 [Vibrio rotiferianus]|nr:hypothetical protein THOG05_380004 [Vibrio rotiferianus]